MTKYYCDCCGEEIKKSCTTHRYKKKKKIGNADVEVEVVVAINGAWNRGDICEKCLLKMFKPSLK